jgi:putative acetyltransferase
MDVRIRDARPGDADAIRAVHRASILELGTEAYSEEQVRAWAAGVEAADYDVTDDDYRFVVAETGGDVVAFGSLRVRPPEGVDRLGPKASRNAVDAEVTGAYVHPEAARDGVGTAVLSTLESRAVEAGVDRLGLKASRNAVPFYEARGYERVAVHDHEFSSERSTGVYGEVVEMCGEP